MTSDYDFLQDFPFPMPASSQSSSENRELPEDFEPGPKDIICGRGKSCWNHVGNRRFRVAIAMNLKRYVEAKSRMDKSQVVHSIVSHLRQSSPNGAFVKMNYAANRWVTIPDDVAREKVGHALRDALAATKETRGPSQFKQSIDKMENKHETIFAAQQYIFRSLELYPSTKREPVTTRAKCA